MRAKQSIIFICIGVCLLLASALFGDLGNRASADTGATALNFDSFHVDPFAQQPCPTPVLERRKCPWSPSGYAVEPCPPGFCFDAGPQGALACKQEVGVPNSGRNYTSDLVCNEGFVAERDRCTNVILRCVKPGAPSAPGNSMTLPKSVEEILPELNKWLTGTATPQPPDQAGAVIATTIGAGLVFLLTLSNYLLSNPSLAQRFARAQATKPTTDARPSAPTPQAAGRGGAGVARPVTTPEQSSSVAQSAAAGATSPPSGQTSFASTASTTTPAPATADGLLNALGEKAVTALPSGRDKVADKLIGFIGEEEKRRRVEEEKKRLRKFVAEKTRAYQDAGNALKQVIDHGGDFAATQRAWQQAGAELQAAQSDLAQLLKEFPDKEA